MKKYIILLINILLFISDNSGQTVYKPLEETGNIIWGQGFGANSLNRFPVAYQPEIPSDVWSRSLQSSGMQVRFKTNATSITVNYSLSAKYTNNSWFSDMGANGMDLYAHRPDGRWCWCYPTQRVVGQTFTYSQLSPNDTGYNRDGYDYCLYLPPFTSVTSLTITVNSGAKFSFIPVPADKKPIVVYGTSIVQGAVCSRPGNLWTNVLSRELPERPLVNFGFSGIGRMEENVIQAVNQVDASLYIFDCLPNMTATDLLPQIKARYKQAVKIVRESHPRTAILLVEHPGHADMDMFLTRRLQVLESNGQLKKAYEELLAEGEGNLFYLSREELALDMTTDMGDYIHPNDRGMKKYADACMARIKGISLEDDPTSVRDHSSAGRVLIYPVPAQDQVTVEIPGILPRTAYSLGIYDMQGHLLQKQEINRERTSISVGNFSKGFYLLKVTNGKETITNKLIIK